MQIPVLPFFFFKEIKPFLLLSTLSLLNLLNNWIFFHPYLYNYIMWRLTFNNVYRTNFTNIPNSNEMRCKEKKKKRKNLRSKYFASKLKWALGQLSHKSRSMKSLPSTLTSNEAEGDSFTSRVCKSHTHNLVQRLRRDWIFESSNLNRRKNVT